jgi:hypothetical protein
MAMNSETVNWKKRLALLFVAMTVLGSSIFAEPLRKRMDFTVSADYRLSMGGYVLPAGNYILYQVADNNSNVFALYQGDMTHSPIAMVQTTRIDNTTSWPRHTKMHWQIEESYGGSIPTITGWQVAGTDGWEIIAVVPSGRGLNVLTRVR